MKTSITRPYSRFCGIDVAKNKHVACIIDREGQRIVRSQSFTNDAEGFQRILDRLKEVGGPSKVAIAMEATGHYWYSLHDFLVGPYGQITMALSYAIALILPIVSTFFIAFGLLEDSGYLPRLAVMVNRVFRVLGLNGKAVLPMVLGLGCDTMATLTTRPGLGASTAWAADSASSRASLESS